MRTLLRDARAQLRASSQGTAVGRRGREVAISNPGKVLFPKPKYTKLDLARYYVALAEGALRGAGGRPNVLVRYPDGIGGEFFQKRAPGSRPGMDRSRHHPFPSGREAEEVVPRDAAALVWLANLARLELHPHRYAPRTWTIPTSCGSTWIRCRGGSGGQVVQVAEVAHAVLSDFKLTGWPKTSGSAASTSTCASSPRWSFDEVRRAAWAGWRAKSSAARRSSPPASGGRRSATASSWTTTRMPRTVPSPPPTGAPQAGCACFGAAHGMRFRIAIRRISRWPPCPPRQADRRPACRHRFTRGFHRATARAVRAGIGRCSPPYYSRNNLKEEAAADRNRQGEAQGRCACRAGALENGIRRRRRIFSPPTSSSMRCAAATALDAHPGEPAARPPSCARPRSRSTPTRRCARARRAASPRAGRSGSPAAACPAASAGRWRAWRKRSPCMWSYFTSHTRSMRSGSHDRSLPALQRLCAPGMRLDSAAAPAQSRRMVLHGVAPQRLELLCELLARRHGEGRGDAHVLQPALTVVQPQKQRADRVLAALVPAQAGDHAPAVRACSSP